MNTLLRLLAASRPHLFERDDYEITPSTMFNLLILRKKSIFIREIGLCRIESFDVCDVCKASGKYIFPTWRKATVLSKIELSTIDPITNETVIKYYDRKSCNMKSIIDLKFKYWRRIPTIFKQPVVRPSAII